uniref:Uncharacterized protein n=1 Tax=Rhizophora mucronata TaxID=61149 RepID=A0A2P2QEC1_RHIMU
MLSDLIFNLYKKFGCAYVIDITGYALNAQGIAILTIISLQLSPLVLLNGDELSTRVF